jgi:hypothetical protein
MIARSFHEKVCLSRPPWRPVPALPELASIRTLVGALGARCTWRSAWGCYLMREL